MIPLFKNSVANLENVDHVKDPTLKEKLLILLDKENIIPKEKKLEVSLENKESGTPLLNIGEFLFLTNPEKKTV